jgi:hypothetical protein
MAYSTVADYLDGITAYGVNLGEGEDVDLMAGGWRRTNAPRVIANAALKASELNRQAEEMAFSAYAEGRGRAENEAERSMLSSLVDSGVNPTMARSMVSERRATSLGTDLSMMRGQLGQQRAQTDIGILGETASGLVQSEQYQDSIDHREDMFQRQLAEQEKARKWGLVGDLAGIAGSFALSPAGAFGKTVLGNAMGMGGDGSQPNAGGWLGGGSPSSLNVNNYTGDAFTPFGAN